MSEIELKASTKDAVTQFQRRAKTGHIVYWKRRDGKIHEMCTHSKPCKGFEKCSK